MYIEQNNNSRCPRAMISQTMSSWPNLQHHVSVSSHRVGLKSNQKVIGYPQNTHVSIAPLEISSHIRSYVLRAPRVHSHVRLLMICFSCSLDTTVQYFENYLTGKKLSFWYQLDFVMFCDQQGSIFSNRVLPLSSGGWPRAIDIACIVWVVSGTPLTNNPREGIPHPGTF